jgi:hypothetical protein
VNSIGTKLTLLYVFFIVFAILSCANADEKNQAIKNQIKTTQDSSDYDIVEQEVAKENKGQVYVIENRAVVFFMLSKAEVQEFYNSLGESYLWDAQALFNNFARQANSFQSLIQKQNIKCIISTSKKFEIHLKNKKVVLFDRVEKDQILGQIFTDGVKEPRIEFGVSSNKELATILTDFFKLQSIGYVPADTLENTEKEDVDSLGI